MEQTKKYKVVLEFKGNKKTLKAINNLLTDSLEADFLEADEKVIIKSIEEIK